jgi:peptide/nickel transport system ATP-binding protein
LLNAAPRLDRNTPGEKRLTTIEGTPPDPLNWPKGCRFAARCPFRIEKCDEHPDLLPVGEARRSRCWVTQMGQNLPRRSQTHAAQAPDVMLAEAALATQPEPILESAISASTFRCQGNTVLAPQVVHAVDGPSS